MKALIFRLTRNSSHTLTSFSLPPSLPSFRPSPPQAPHPFYLELIAAAAFQAERKGQWGYLGKGGREVGKEVVDGSGLVLRRSEKVMSSIRSSLFLPTPLLLSLSPSRPPSLLPFPCCRHRALPPLPLRSSRSVEARLGLPPPSPPRHPPPGTPGRANGTSPPLPPSLPPSLPPVLSTRL